VINLSNDQASESKVSIENQEKQILNLEKGFTDKLNELSEAKNNLSVTEQQLEILQTDLKEKSKLLDETTNNLTSLTETNTKNEEKIIKLEKEVVETTAEFSNLKEEFVPEIKKEFQEQISRQSRAIRSQREDLEKRETEIKELQEKLEKSVSSSEQLLKKIDEQKEKLETDSNEKENLTSQLNKKISSLESDIKDKDQMIEKYEEQSKKSKAQKTGLITGQEEIISLMNNLLENARMRVQIVAPTIEEINLIDFSKIPKKVNVRIATFIDLSDDRHKDILEGLTLPNITFRNYKKKDRWGLEQDREGLIIAAESKKALPLGLLTNDLNHIELFNSMISEAWIQGRPL